MERCRFRLLVIVGLVMTTNACIPVPSPSTVRVDEPPAFEPARLNAPESSEILDCVGRRLTEGRADLEIVEAGPVWEALRAQPEDGISIDGMLEDAGACGQMELQQVDYLVTVQHAQESGKTQGGIQAVLYGVPHGPVWGFGYVDHGMVAAVYKATGESCGRVRAIARERAGVANIGPFLPGPWLIVFPVGDPARKACEALGEALSQAMPPDDHDGSVSVLLFEAGPPPDESLTPWPGEQ